MYHLTVSSRWDAQGYTQNEHECQWRLSSIWVCLTTLPNRPELGGPPWRIPHFGTWRHFCLQSYLGSPEQWTLECRTVPLHGTDKVHMPASPLEGRELHQCPCQIKTAKDGGTSQIFWEPQSWCVLIMAQPIVELVVQALLLRGWGRLIRSQLPRKLSRRNGCRLVCSQCR